MSAIANFEQILSETKEGLRSGSRGLFLLLQFLHSSVANSSGGVLYM